MNRRILLAAILLLGGYGLFVLISGAPLRVHIARGITWIPVMYMGCLIYWNQSLIWKKKLALLALVVGAGSLLAAYATSRVILKFDFGSNAIFGSAIILFLGMVIVIGLTSFLERILSKKDMSHKEHR